MRLCCALLLFTSSLCLATENTVNVFAWAGEIPNSVVAQFEKDTGITVNFATFDSNETLYAKLKAKKNPGYDVIMPSSYFVDRMRSEGMLLKMDKQRLDYLTDIESTLRNPSYDPRGNYTAPYLWGFTGIFFNAKSYSSKDVKCWADLWSKKFHGQLLLLNDMREVFSIALLSLGYSINDSQPKHIEQAYRRLKALSPNIKLYNSTATHSLLIDEDVPAGMIWSGDFYQAKQHNRQLHFTYPCEGYVLWIDTLAIAAHAPHKTNAYRFINYVMQPEHAVKSVLEYGYASGNAKTRQLLPAKMRNSQIIYPSKYQMRRAKLQRSLSQETLRLYTKYWERLKLS